MDKKIGLEHTIRNVVSESIGVSGTDKYQGTPRAFLKPAPLISPKKGDEHPNGSATLAQRGRDKIDSSKTMRIEGKIGLEHTIREVMLKEYSRRNEPIVTGVDNLVGKNLDDWMNWMLGRKPKAFSPDEVKPAVAPDVSSPKVEPTPEVKPKPEAKPEVKPKPEAKPEVKPKPEAKPKSEVKPKPEAKPKGSFIPPLGGLGTSPFSGLSGDVAADIYVHHAASRKTFGENFSSDAKIIKKKSRKAQIIRKVLDEKKKKDTETVNMNPKLKNPDLTEADSFLQRTKNYLTNPQTYKDIAKTGAKIGTGSATGFALGALVGPEATEYVDKKTGPTIDKTIENNPLLKKIMPTGKRDPKTGAFQPDNKKLGYDQTTVGDALDTVTFGGAKYAKAGIDYTLKNIGAKLGLSKPTDYETELKQAKEKLDFKNDKARKFDAFNPATYGNAGIDTVGNVMQMVPYKPSQLAGTALVVGRDIARRDLVNTGLDLLQAPAKKGPLKYTSGPFGGSVISGAQVGTEWGKGYRQRTEPAK
jgi:hypothetical protein